MTVRTPGVSVSVQESMVRFARDPGAKGLARQAVGPPERLVIDQRDLEARAERHPLMQE